MGDLELKNRVILASMTRNRNLVPQQVNIDFYTQRANAGLVLTEGTLVAQQGTQWPEAPGIYTEEQTEAWKKVVDSVHNAGGLIFLQVRGSDYQLTDRSCGMWDELLIQIMNCRNKRANRSLAQVL
jgi:2,4-dienoyl-CoA reductase-like NADH-dependent reductase (Old Yellow Enzyme family)